MYFKSISGPGLPGPELPYKISIEVNGKSNDEVGTYVHTKLAIWIFYEKLAKGIE